MKPGAKEVNPVLHRWTIHTTNGSVSEQQLDDKSVEFPRVPDALIGLKHRYGYMAEFGSGLPTAVAFRKYDLSNNSSVAHELGAGRFGGEPVFVPADNAQGEDEGYLMSFVYDAQDNKSELVIVDAASMDNEPVATVHLPTRVPAGFHGSWVAD